MAKIEKEIECPFCQSSESAIIANFGTAQLVKQYYCIQCQSIFEHIRWQADKST